MQKRSAYLRACTQNASTNDNIGYPKGQESPDIPLLILHIIEHMTQDGENIQCYLEGNENEAIIKLLKLLQKWNFKNTEQKTQHMHRKQ